MADYQVKILPLGTYEVLYGFLISMVVGKTGEQDGSRGRGAKRGGESADHPPHHLPYQPPPPHHHPHPNHSYHPLRHRPHYPPLLRLKSPFHFLHS